MTDEEYLSELGRLMRSARGELYEVLKEAERRALAAGREGPVRKRDVAWNEYMRRYRKKERELLRKARSQPDYPNPFGER